MRNTNSKVRCEKRQMSKCNEVVRTYNDLQFAFANILENDTTVKEFICNYPLSDFPLTDGKYTSDFYCTTIEGDIVVYAIKWLNLGKQLSEQKVVLLWMVVKFSMSCLVCTL